MTNGSSALSLAAKLQLIADEMLSGDQAIEARVDRAAMLQSMAAELLVTGSRRWASDRPVEALV